MRHNQYANVYSTIKNKVWIFLLATTFYLHQYWKENDFGQPCRPSHCCPPPDSQIWLPLPAGRWRSRWWGTVYEPVRSWMILNEWNLLFAAALKFEGFREPQFEFICQPQISQKVRFYFSILHFSSSSSPSPLLGPLQSKIIWPSCVKWFREADFSFLGFPRFPPVLSLLCCCCDYSEKKSHQNEREDTVDADRCHF